ncbi:MAG TPA: hypothetical protein VFO83_15410 [Aggregicoccus sp.]|nr:hypothetical protein [Aggregicoccus sp.]
MAGQKEDSGRTGTVQSPSQPGLIGGSETERRERDTRGDGDVSEPRRQAGTSDPAERNNNEEPRRRAPHRDDL